MTDPFEEATQGTANTTGTGTASATDGARGVPAGPLGNVDDPFSTASEFAGSGGGQWDARVQFEDLEGKLVVMKPTRFEPKANKPENYRQSADDLYREEYRVELWLLTGESFSFDVTRKDKDGTETTETVQVNPSAGTKVGEVLVPGSRFRSQSIPQGQLIKALKGVDDQGRMLIGVMSRVPTVTDARKGVTPEDITAKRAAWVKGGARGEAPRSTWNLDDRAHVYTPALKSVAGAWWAEYRKTL